MQCTLNTSLGSRVRSLAFDAILLPACLETMCGDKNVHLLRNRGKQSFNSYETTGPHPNSTCTTPIFHTTESSSLWREAVLENSDVDEVMRYL